MPNSTEGGFARNVWKAFKWAHLPGTNVPTVTLPNGTVAEGVAALGYAWDATAGDYVKLSVEHTSNGLNMYRVN